MPQDIADHLTFLYGTTTGEAVEPRLRELIGRHRSERMPAAGSVAAAARHLPLTQRDALLITYGDQVREPDAPPLQTLGEFLEEHAAGAISGVHVLPFYPSSSDDGFSVIDYRAVDPELGTWDDVCRLGRRFDLMFDAVFNHVSAGSAWFQGFLRDDPIHRDWFIVVDDDPDLSQVVRPRALPLLTTFPTAAGDKRVWTTFSADQVDVNVQDPDVLLELIDVLLLYIGLGARFIRLDAIAYLWKEIGTSCIHLPQTHRVIQLMRAVLDQVAPDAMLITETNVPHRDNVSYFGDGGNEAQLVYNFALPPLVLHSIATGSATALTRWAADLDAPSDRVTFFNFLASHDGIGVNPVRGILREDEIDALVRRAPAHGGYVSYKHNPDGSRSPYELNINYFDALSDPAADEPEETQVRRFLVAHAIMLAMPGMPGIYFHSLFGSRGDRAGAEASGIPRRINRQKLTRALLERELADPASRRARVLFELKALLRQRQASAVFHPAGRCEVVKTDPRVFALRRSSPDGAEAALCLHNVSAETVRAEGRVLGPYQVLWSPEP
ncbi:MAG TPA: sugar phosphorylase [Candidatus Dormibacteraeota bacterium]|nr:sugar phosphorylase [Candidatus Dormibacteraeota bacterium]